MIGLCEASKGCNEAKVATNLPRFIAQDSLPPFISGLNMRVAVRSETSVEILLHRGASIMPD